MLKRLLHNEFNAGSAQTAGIQITPWSLPVEGEAVALYVWELGGQSIMLATHQFFLTERSVYAIVLSGREGAADQDAEYWLKLIASFGRTSPVIVVLNKLNEHPFDVNRGALQQKYPTIKAFVGTDCKSRLGIGRLREALIATLSAWKASRVEFPAPWFRIKQRLSGMSESYLSFEQFQGICSELGEGDAGAQLQLAAYLHDLGLALNYKSDPRLSDTHVLKPHWITGGIYRILTAKVLPAKKGELHFTDLANILPMESYPPRARIFSST